MMSGRGLLRIIARMPQKLPPTIAAIVPCYNAGHRIMPVVEQLVRYVETVIVIDDGSTDSCTLPLAPLPARVIYFPENRGKGFALMKGYAAALEDPEVTCVASLDADGQHDPAELPGLYEAFEEQRADLLIGSRQFGADVPLRSRFGNTITIAVVSRLLGQRLPDTQSGYRLLSRRFLEAMIPVVDGGRYETEMELIGRAIAGGYTVASHPIQTIYEEGNRSSHFRKISDSFRIYRTLLRVARRPD